jgi:cytochrome c-type biogenesis protein CcmH/NrfG
VVEPNNVQALLGLAASHGILNEHQPAMVAFDRLIVLQPDNVEALLGKAMSAFALV